MRFHSRLLAAALTAALASAAQSAGGGVTVSYDPDTSGYTDAGATAREREQMLQTLAAHLRQLGDRYLPADETLKVELLDIELAGTMRPSVRAGHDLRIVNGGADWPRVRLRYSLEAPDGKALKRGEETLTDMSYTQRGIGSGNSERLGYEKRLLDDWFRSRFVQHRPERG